jgi:adenylyltransferase/sulfurtransferase
MTKDTAVDQAQYNQRQRELWGAETQEGLHTKHVAIVGCGGLGSAVALALAGSGIGRIDVVDFDTVALHNLHRQIALTVADIDRPKAEVVAEAIRARNPFTEVVAYPMNFEAFEAQAQSIDLIIDATDNLPTRLRIDRYAKSHSIAWMYGSVEAFNGQAGLIEHAQFPLGDNATHTPQSTVAPMVMQIAAFQANWSMRYLAGLPVERDVLYYLYVSESGEWMTQKFGIPTDS